MKIVVLASRFPFPIEKGDKLRMYHQLRGLCMRHEVHLISITHREVSEEANAHIEDMCHSVTVCEKQKLSSSIGALAGVFNDLPFQVSYFFSKSIKMKLHKRIHEINPDVIYCQLARMSEYVKDLSYPKVLDYMDAFSLNYSRRASHEKHLVKKFFQAESSRLHAYEKSISSHFDNSVIISAADRNAIGLESKAKVVSNGLDTAFFTPQSNDKEFDVVFVGNMGYHPNILAAKYLVSKVVPLLEAGISVQIAGARPSAAVRSLASSKVKITGWLDDIRLAYGNSRIFVAPIFSGAGQQNKILEAMSMEMICVTTPIVNDSIGAEDKKEILIARNASEFAKIIAGVLKNMDSYKSIAVNARNFVKAKFSWDQENNKLNEILIEASNNKLKEEQ